MSEELNQTIQDASLDNLHDILLPDPIGFFPLAPGWIIVFAFVTALGFHFLWKWYVRYMHNRYKREAIKELQRYTNKNRETMLSLLSLAKRVAIAAYGREKIARLDGEAWWNFMETHSQAKLDKRVREDIERLLYDTSASIDTMLYNPLYICVEVWIKTHKVVKDV